MGSVRITNAMLKGACEEQRALFRKTWPKGAAITVANARKAATLGLDADWVAERFLGAPAREAYEKAKAPAWEAYMLVRWLTLVPLLREAVRAEAAKAKGVGRDE